jgi:type II secretory pathway pseudopilin PulG
MMRATKRRSDEAKKASLAYTLVEMLTTVAVLIVLLGLMVSLARYVRGQSAERLTKDLLVTLDHLMAQYVNSTGGKPPEFAPFLPADASVDHLPDELSLDRLARTNNSDVIRILRGQRDLAAAAAFKKLPISIYDEVTIRDAWGSPIVYMPHMHPLIGMPFGDVYFFFSAGPDRKFLTRDDNLYSYETTAER